MKSETYKHPFARSIAAKLETAGLSDAELVSSTPDSSSFGDAEAVFRCGLLILRFVKDRGQELLDVASTASPDRLFLFDDLAVAMGWRTIDEVLAKQEPESLDVVLTRLARYVRELNEAFSWDREPLTRAGVERAARDRGDAFMKRLRNKK